MVGIASGIYRDTKKTAKGTQDLILVKKCLVGISVVEFSPFYGLCGWKSAVGESCGEICIGYKLHHAKYPHGKSKFYTDKKRFWMFSVVVFVSSGSGATQKILVGKQHLSRLTKKRRANKIAGGAAFISFLVGVMACCVSRDVQYT